LCYDYNSLQSGRLTGELLFLLYKISHAEESSTFKITSNATNATGVVADKYKLPLNIPRIQSLFRLQFLNVQLQTGFALN
jgi:hypothetical protein